MAPANPRSPHRFPVRLWLLPVVAATCALGMFGTATFASAEPSDTPGSTTTPTPPPPDSTTTVPPVPTTTTTTTTPRPHTTTDTPPPPPVDEGRLTLCPLANQWSPADTGITATVYEYGPATVTVDVSASSGNQSKTITVSAGDYKAAIDFPEISPSDVRGVIVRAVGPGPLPTRCLLSRGS